MYYDVYKEYYDNVRDGRPMGTDGNSVFYVAEEGEVYAFGILSVLWQVSLR